MADRWHSFVALGFGLNGGLAKLVAKPPAPAVRSLMQGDAVDPCLQAGVGVEALDSAKNLEEDFLSGIGGVGGVFEDPVDQAVNGLVVMGDEPGKSRFRSGLQFGHHGGFFGADSYRTCQVTQCCCSRHGRHLNDKYFRNLQQPTTTALDALTPRFVPYPSMRVRTYAHRAVRHRTIGLDPVQRRNVPRKSVRVDGTVGAGCGAIAPWLQAPHRCQLQLAQNSCCP